MPITYDDKDNSLPTSSARRLVRAVDMNEIKNVVNANETTLSTKAPSASPTFSGTVSGITKSMVGLGNIDNTSDANKPVSTAQQTALDFKANTATFVDNEVPSGTLDSINDTFTLANTPIAGSVKIYQNGIRLKGGGIDYNVSGSTITFSTAPQAFDILLCDYRK